MYSLNNDSDLPAIKVLLANHPVALLGDKVDVILDNIKKYTPQTVLEIGTFAGGASHIIARTFPNTPVYTVDINSDYTQFSHDPDFLRMLDNVRSWCPEIEIDPSSIVKIRNLYDSMNKNLTLLLGDVTTHSRILTNIDFAIVDGGHTDHELESDLNFCFKQAGVKVAIIDDCVHTGIANVCKKFAEENNLSIEFTHYRDYGSQKGYDLAIISLKLAEL